MSDDIIVTLRRQDGTETKVRVPAEQLQRLMDLANGEFGDRTIVLDGPKLTVVEKK